MTRAASAFYRTILDGDECTMASSLPRRLAIAAAAIALIACGSDGANAPIPVTRASLTIQLPDGEWYPGDVVTLRALVRDATGEVVPDAPVTWSVSSAAHVELASDGAATLLKPGRVTVTARHGSVAESDEITIRPLFVNQVTVSPSALQLRVGDASPLGVRVSGAGGRDVPGRVVTLSSDNATIAFIDAAGRVHAVAPGVTTVRARADGVTGTARVEVAHEPAVRSLSRVDGSRLPLLVAADTVSWDGVREYHEVFIEGGELTLSGAGTPRYAIDIRYAEYVVTGPAGQRDYRLLHLSREADFGLVTLDARGDYRFTSEWIAPLHHTASAVSGGIEVRFRVPGDDTYLTLLYRRD